MAPKKILAALRAHDAWAPPVFLLGFVALVWLLRALGSPVYRSGEIREDLEKLAELEEHGRAFVVGSSHGKDIRLDRAGLSGQNFSHNGQDLFEMVYIARSVRQRVPRVDTVIVTLSYFSFTFDNAAYRRGGANNRVEKRINMYAAFARPAFVWGDGPEFLKGLLYSVVTRDHFQAGFRSLGRRIARLFGGKPARKSGRDVDAPPLASAADSPEAEPDGEAAVEEDATEGEPDEATDAPEKSRKRRRFPKINKTEAWYGEHARLRCTSYLSLMRNMRSHSDLEDDAYRALHAMAAEFERDGVNVVLVTPPYYSVYNQCFDRRSQKLMRDNAKRIARETGARYFDFSTTNEFMVDRELFLDADHLRPSGRSTFSRLLGKAIGTRRR